MGRAAGLQLQRHLSRRTSVHAHPKRLNMSPRNRHFAVESGKPLLSTASLRAQASSVENKPAISGIDMKERLDFLKADLDNLFNDKGVDQSQYDDKVNFMDPITKYGSVRGYMFNIKMLKLIFAPSFQLHDIKQTGDFEITTRWTMIMQPTFNRKLRLQRWWDPRLIFTGVSIMGVNPDNGKFNKHIDLWDALEPENQEFLSREGVSHVFSQLTSPLKTPDLDGPEYTLLKKKKHYEVRRYEPFIVAEAPMKASDSRSSGPSSRGEQSKGAFNSLAGYIFGGNQEQQKMQMQTPVFTNSQDRMQFVIGKNEEEQSFPTPKAGEVERKRQKGGLYAALTFNGNADSALVEEKREELKEALRQDRLEHRSSEWVLARYNDPSTRPRNRRNEVLIPVESFDIWEG